MLETHRKIKAIESSGSSWGRDRSFLPASDFLTPLPWLHNVTTAPPPPTLLQVGLSFLPCLPPQPSRRSDPTSRCTHATPPHPSHQVLGRGGSHLSLPMWETREDYGSPGSPPGWLRPHPSVWETCQDHSHPGLVVSTNHRGLDPSLSGLHSPHL